MPFKPKEIKRFLKYIDSLKVPAGKKKINLAKDFDTDYDRKMFVKEQSEGLLDYGVEKLSELQDKLYAHNQYSLLIVLQAMDAAGKDSAIKHVMSGLNPSGVKVHSFKAPTSTELEHDYLWRHYLALPARGEIGIFNRSHYENVLVTRVHPEYILKENLPSITHTGEIDHAFWKRRFEQINHFEKSLHENGTVVIKFFLHVSQKEQKKRLIDRIDDPTKNWKFDLNDLHERTYWSQYQKAYEELLQATSTEIAPWYVLPADDKWFTRLCLAAAIYQEFKKLDIHYPEVSLEMKEKLQQAKATLLAE